jgi:hypothetical protein
MEAISSNSLYQPWFDPTMATNKDVSNWVESVGMTKDPGLRDTKRKATDFPSLIDINSPR